jgi:HipA-like protein
MRKANVYRNQILAGELIETDEGKFMFNYDDMYFQNDVFPAVSLTLPKTIKTYESKFLFPFFCNMLSEGVNRKLQCRSLKIDEKDDFGLLMSTARVDTVGAINIKPLHEE